MSNQSEQAQSARLLIQRLQSSIALAAFSLVLSVTPLGAGWSVFVPLAPEWQGIPNAVASLMPHEIFVSWVADGWAGVMGGLADAGVITDAAASALIRDGIASEILLRGFAFIVLVIGWIISMRMPRASSQTTTETVVDTAPTQAAAEPVGVVQEIVSALATRVAQQELLVQNMLLDPQAQPVAESLAELSQSLRALKADMQRHEVDL